MMTTYGNLLIPELTQNTKVKGLSFDDISYVIALYYAIIRNSGITFKHLSSLITNKDIKDEFSFAYLSHSQAFSNNIIEISNQLKLTDNSNYTTLSNAFDVTDTISSLCFLVSINMRIMPETVLHDIFESGYADELIGIDFNKQHREQLLLDSIKRLYGDEALSRINPATKY